MPCALLWHLHQPEYRDPATGRPCMPWTRLHALRGYRDLLVETAESGVPWTLNIVPGLWEQLLYYVKGGSDGHLDLTERASDSLTEAEQRRVMATFPCGHPNLRSHLRYRELEDRIRAGRMLTPAELLDLQVWSTLAWMGATALRDFPELRELRTKGRGFTEADKHTLLRAQRTMLDGYPALLRRVAETEGPALSTTPLHHPILPLLVDLAHAARSVRSAPTATFRRPEDALRQLIEGRALLEAHTGVPIRGCWPSEGAISPEVVPLLAQAGFRWVASDEEVLSRSVRDGAGEGGWDLGHGVVGFFRDRSLSDRIGFDYARWPAAAAIQDFVRRSASTGTKLVALDGENPWESYEDAGAALRKGMIAHLGTNGITLDEAAQLQPVGRVERLHTGSWIGANLEIWAGDTADHRAWQLLADAREAADVEAAIPHLLAAEGSDWFWWYGPEFDTPFAGTFDAAFRGHLAAAYSAAGLRVPEELHQPIVVERIRSSPPGRPIVGGDTLAGWFGAGEWTLPQGSMAHAGGLVVRYGWDPTGQLWIQVPPGIEVHVDGTAWAAGSWSLGQTTSAVLTVGPHELTVDRLESAVAVDWVV